MKRIALGLAILLNLGSAWAAPRPQVKVEHVFCAETGKPIGASLLITELGKAERKSVPSLFQFDISSSGDVKLTAWTANATAALHLVEDEISYTIFWLGDSDLRDFRTVDLTKSFVVRVMKEKTPNSILAPSYATSLSEAQLSVEQLGKWTAALRARLLGLSDGINRSKGTGNEGVR